MINLVTYFMKSDRQTGQRLYKCKTDWIYLFIYLLANWKSNTSQH